MARLIIVLFLLIAAIIVAAAVWSLVEATRPAPATCTKEDTMPKTFRTVAYILLILFMLGVAFGLIGGV